mmetsp:Transcript_32799/g.32023  ORF Transcript_32799/g.32023 Transcript_32799/m.32023 type:complete len:146 (+) Transcript_32799:148-585(+)
MLPLGDFGQLYKAVEALKSVEEKIKALVASKGSLTLTFTPGVQYFGTEDQVRVIYKKLEENDNYEMLLDIGHMLIEAMLAHKVIKKQDLCFIKFNNKTKRYEPDQLHLTLLNATFSLKDLMKNGKKVFNGKEIIESVGSSLDFGS